MTLKLNERYPGRFNNPSSDYPQGSFKNRTAPGAKDGSYLEQDWANDKEGFFQSLLDGAGIPANGSVDRVGASQAYDALKATILSVAVRQATEALIGSAKVATQSQTNTGADDTSFVTPKKLASWFSATFGQATTAVLGLVKIATDAMVAAGTDDTSAITSLRLKNRSQSSPVDVTAGRLLTPGAFGLGGVSPAFPGNDLNTTVNYSGTFGTSTGCLNAPPGWNVQGSIVKHDVWLSVGTAQQVFEEHITGRTARRALNSGIWGEWAEIVQGISGAVMFFAMSTAPASWLVCNGSAISRATYATLFSKIGVLYGAGDGSTTFNIPDMRGEFPRGLDLGRGVDIGRKIGSAQAGDIQSHTHRLQYGSNPGVNFGTPGYSAASAISSAGVEATGGTETRPRNIALLPCIKI